jgi:hypothetical protein
VTAVFKLADLLELVAAAVSERLAVVAAAGKADYRWAKDQFDVHERGNGA